MCNLVVIMMLLAGGVFAQTGQVTGQISDPSGASIPSANITVLNTRTGVSSSTTTNTDGYYTVPFLVPGDYTVTAAKDGFKTATSAIKLDVSQIARIDLRLVIGSQTEKIDVTTSGPLLQSESASVGQVIDEKTVTDLPLNGRNFTQLTTLTPGASTGSPGSPYVHGITVLANGMRASNTIFLVNGVNTTDMDYLGTAIFPPPDAIEEFKLQSGNLDTDLGLGGVVVSLELKGGTNKFHGSVYEFLRNNDLDSRNFFSASVPILKQNQFGFTLGGPIRKDKTFFFVDYEGTRTVSGTTSNDVVATAAIKAGDFSGLKAIIDPTTGKAFPGNLIPTSRISPQAAFFLPFFPLPNTPQGTFVYAGRQVSDNNQFDIRIDHHISDADTLRFTYSFLQPYLYVPGSFPDNGGATTNLRHQAAGLTEAHTFSPDVINEFTLGYARMRSFGVQQGAGTNYTVQSGIGGFDVTSAQYPGFPALTPSGYTGLTNNAFEPLDFVENNYNIHDLVSIVKGKHIVQAGVDFTRHSNYTTNSAHNRGEFTFNGTFTGNAFADYLLGIPYTGSRSFPRDLFGYADLQFEPFVQDTWKITPRLTLTAGLRYSLYPQPSLFNNALSSVNSAANQIVVASDSHGNIQLGGQQVAQYAYPLFANIIVPSSKVGLNSSLKKPNDKNFAPRLGMAWQPGGGFVIRTGYSILHSIYSGGVIETPANPPFYADQTSIFNTTPIPTLTLANFFPPISVGNFSLPPLSFSQIDPNSPNPYFQQWNFAIQKAIGGALSVEAAYVGIKGTHLGWSNLVNVPLPGPGTIQNRRQNQTFSSGSLLEENDNSSYNGLQTKVTTQTWKGLDLLSTFTWSKSLDYALGTDPHSSTQQDPNNFRGERGPYGPAARFTLSGVYELPFLKNRHGLMGYALGGWELTSIVTAQSGLPFNPTISTDPANTGTSKRPNRIGNGALPNPSINEWFNVAAFTLPAAYTYGNSGVNILTGPGSADWDSGLFKNFRIRRISEAAYLQFRAEFFNFLNKPNFANPQTNIQSSTAGKILSAGTPRQIQFALKLVF